MKMYRNGTTETLQRIITFIEAFTNGKCFVFLFSCGPMLYDMKQERCKSYKYPTLIINLLFQICVMYIYIYI